MNHSIVHLKDFFPILGEQQRDPTLTLYLPDNLQYPDWKDRKHPGILICPGGGYRACSDREAEVIALQFLCRGYNAFVLNYSVYPHGYPTQLREVAGAMELIHRNADLWHCESNRLAILGFSAGGHLAAHYSNCFDCEEVRQAFPESKPVQASILCYPVISADPTFRHTGSFQRLSGHEDITPEDIDDFSLEKKVTERTPPTFLWHTSQDNTVPVKNSLVYAQALAEKQIPFALHVYPFGGHGLSTVNKLTNDALEPKVTMGENWISALWKWLEFNL